MKQGIFKICMIIVVIVIIVIIFFVTHSGMNKKNQTNEMKRVAKVLENVERIPVSSTDYEEKNLGEQQEEKQQIANEEAEKLLNYLSISLNEIETVSSIQKEGKILKRLMKENYQIDFKETGDIDAIWNKDKLTEGEYLYQDEESIQPIIDELSELLELSQYKLVECNGGLVGTWYLMWNGVLDNEIINPFDAVVITLYAENGKIMAYHRNKLVPDCNITIMKRGKAIELAKSSVPEMQSEKVKEAEIVVARPNFYWEGGGLYRDVDFVRLAWKISYENKKYVWVDAETGECLGGGDESTFGKL